MLANFPSLFFNSDQLTILMIVLVGFIGLCVCSFAYRYMKGDAKYRAFFIQFILLIASVLLMVSVDNLIILLISWCLSNALLVRLMIHKPNWKAAKASGAIALKNYCLGTLFIGTAFALFYLFTGEVSIKAIIHEDANSVAMLFALLLLLMAAMTQSAIWPFHRWLISSLNSPTPVSAMMHAGLVNGGGFLLVRFAPLYLQHPLLLNLIFLIGLLTALLGTLWKLMQSDVKRMLACSTMGQMGFMLAQCGLGLFPAAVAHLLWHAMFKAYLFLASGNAAKEKRFDLADSPKLLTFICALLCGFTGSLAFGYVGGKSWLAGDTTLVLMIISSVAGCQIALTVLRINNFKMLPLAFIAVVIAGGFYGISVRIIGWFMEPMQLMQPQPLNILHIFGIVVLTLSWLATLLVKRQAKATHLPCWALKGYVAALNASQPHPQTVTAHRNQYDYQ